MDSSRHPSVEPSRMILLDLTALVVGAAVLASLHWWSVGMSTPFALRSLGWYDVLLILREASSKACLALVPVMLARRAQFGGLLRPAELLAASIGLPQFALAATHWPIFGLLERTEDGFLVPSLDAYLAFHVGLAVLGLMGAVLFLIGRRRWPGWAWSSCLLAAFLGLQGGGAYLLDQAGRSIVGDFRYDTLSIVLTFHVASSPLYLFLTVPVLASLRSFRRRSLGPTWLEWACVVLSASSFLTVRVSLLVGSWFAGFPAGYWRDWAISNGFLVLALLVSVPIVRHIGPAWDVASKIEYDGRETTSDDSPKE